MKSILYAMYDIFNYSRSAIKSAADLLLVDMTELFYVPESDDHLPFLTQTNPFTCTFLDPFQNNPNPNPN